MPIGQTIPNFSSTKNFPLLGTDYSEDLHVKVELGRLYIPPKNTFLEGKVVLNTVDNPFHPNPGGDQGKPFVNPDLRLFFSEGLTKNTNGALCPHIPLKGAPYCTFLDVSMAPNEIHPLYNLIQSPPDLPTVTFNGAQTYNTNQPIIINYNFNIGIDSQPTQYGKIGDLYIPATTATDQAVAALKLPTLVSYNFWTVDNINSQYFNIIHYLGYLQKNTIQIQNSLPYAVVVSNTETAEIQAFASNSVISLTRMYPILKDIAHDKDSKYYFWDSAFSNPPILQVNSIGLYNNIQPVGFVINFTTITLASFVPTYINTEAGTFLKEPMLSIMWGDLDFLTDGSVRESYIKDQKIGLYNFVSTLGEKPKIYFNITNSDIQNGQVDPNKNNISLSSFSSLGGEGSKSSSSEKSPANFSLYVFYSGQYMYVGNSSDTGKWTTLGDPPVSYLNEAGDAPKYSHWLDEKTKIRITAWFMDFTFTYGPPLFSPFDKKNIPTATNINPVNGANYYAGFSILPTNSISDVSSAEDIQNFITDYSIKTFDNPSNNPSRFIGGASAYTDIRAVAPAFKVGLAVSNQIDGTSFINYKITWPIDLGGHVFNKFMPDKVPSVPSITESFVKYDLQFADNAASSLSISEILSQSVSDLKISKKVDQNTATSLTSDLSVQFLNLNRDENSFNVLQYIRKNIAVLRVSAGYGDDMHIYFEGVVESVSIKEALDSTIIDVKAIDLLQWLFIEPETLIVSRTGFSFPGMRFYDMINSLVERTELKNHFDYQLGDPSDPSTIAHAFTAEGQDSVGLPKILDSMLVPELANLRVVPYSDQSTYFSVLSKVCQLLLQTQLRITSNRDKNTPAPLVDAPIMYWFSDKVANDKSVDGIRMSSRASKIDEDLFFFRKKNVYLGLTTSVQELHGYIVGSEGGGFSFQSESSAKNIFRQGIYFFQNEQQRQFVVTAPNKPEYSPPGPIQSDYLSPPKIGDPNSKYLTNPYIGYDKLVIYSNEDKEGSTSQLSQLILPDKQKAQTIINKFYNVFNNSVYENINLSAYVTKPLKSYGHFKICIEDEGNPVNENYLYISVDYDFKIFENVIQADVKAAKKPILS